VGIAEFHAHLDICSQCENQPFNLCPTGAALLKEAAMDPFGLTDKEKRFLALAVQGITLRQGPEVFTFALSLAKKLGLEEYLKEYLQSWIQEGGLDVKRLSSSS